MHIGCFTNGKLITKQHQYARHYVEVVHIISPDNFSEISHDDEHYYSNRIVFIVYSGFVVSDKRVHDSREIAKNCILCCWLTIVNRHRIFLLLAN